MSTFQKQWFESWFDSPYYHILYKERDEQEAQRFLDKLIQLLRPAAYARILDVACGRGRHAAYLSKKGFDVFGFDLSEASIEYDKKMENDHLSFYVHDMKEIFRVNYFDYVLNLFSSFGYFDSPRDNTNVIRANALNLKQGGMLIIDYMNSYSVIQNFVAEDNKEIDGIKFLQQRKIEDGKIIKNISFSAENKEYHYEEHLQLFQKEDFEKMFRNSHLETKYVFGDYDLNPFDRNTSERLILIAEKN